MIALGLALSGCKQDGAPAAGSETVNRSSKQDRLDVTLRRIDVPAKVAVEGALAPSSLQPTVAPAAPPPSASSRLPTAFFSALGEHEKGARQRPVTVLHLGDGIAAAGGLGTALAEQLQRRFGDAGPGLLAPPGSYPRQRQPGLRMTRAGPWRTSSVDTPATVVGLSGFRADAERAEATMTVEVTGPVFDWAEITFLTGPGQGTASIAVDQAKGTASTRTLEAKVVRVRVPVKGRRLTLGPKGDGPIAVLGVELGRGERGIRYATLGRPAATPAALLRMDKVALANELAHMRPELIVLSYGTQASLDDRLDVAAYAASLKAAVGRLRSLAPQASVLVIGPANVAKLPAHAGSHVRDAPATACQPLSAAERAGYQALLKAADPRLARWHEPVRHGPLNRALATVAHETGAMYWDWSRWMGGACGIQAWVHAKEPLARRDHATLTSAGYERTAREIYRLLLDGYARRGAVQR
ncbi:MAG: hypothetical protein R3D31_17720 [Hyphomicrobiaceae bacterium]